MGRSRSRSRSRDREKRRTRSRSRERRRSRSPEGGSSRRERRGGWDAPASQPSDALQAMQAIAAQQQQLMLQRQMMGAPGGLPFPGLPGAIPGMPMVAPVAAPVAPTAPNPEYALDAPPSQVNRKQRELYIGNLTVGVVTGEMLRELFNAVLAAMVPDPVSTPPVMEVKIDASGRFAFVEYRTAGLALAALQLDKLELAGRTLNIGRPKGYVEPPGVEQQAKLTAALQIAAQVSGGPTNVVLLDNLMPAPLMRDDEERRELYDDVYMEAVKCGTVVGLAVPIPPPHVTDSESARVYVKYTTQDAAVKLKAMMDGREFDDRKVKATYAADDHYYRSQANEWLPVS